MIRAIKIGACLAAATAGVYGFARVRQREPFDPAKYVHVSELTEPGSEQSKVAAKSKSGSDSEKLHGKSDKSEAVSTDAAKVDASMATTEPVKKRHRRRRRRDTTAATTSETASSTDRAASDRPSTKGAADPDPSKSGSSETRSTDEATAAEPTPLRAGSNDSAGSDSPKLKPVRRRRRVRRAAPEVAPSTPERKSGGDTPSDSGRGVAGSGSESGPKTDESHGEAP